ncbi:unnamed protein product [Sphagnum jensenii]|uniref:PPPDE domain-containing protein n=1 Tax=Sphagnum jensenii TaxID=128206 RepID=A0ABP0X0K8_9BRYO
MPISVFAALQSLSSCKEGWKGSVALILLTRSFQSFALLKMRGDRRCHPGGSNIDSGVPVHLNVYDLTPMNGYVYWVGLGIYHSGIEAHGAEYAFGAHDYATSGVFEVEPKHCPGFTFRRTVLLGTTDLNALEFRSFIEQCADDYHGDTYHLIAKNCNHFSDDVCRRLIGRSIPGWVNRLARIGYMCNCLLPEGLQVTVTETSEFPNGVESGEAFGEGKEMCLPSSSPPLVRMSNPIHQKWKEPKPSPTTKRHTDGCNQKSLMPLRRLPLSMLINHCSTISMRM